MIFQAKQLQSRKFEPATQCRRELRKRQMTDWHRYRPAIQAHSDKHAQPDLNCLDAPIRQQHHGCHAGMGIDQNDG